MLKLITPTFTPLVSKIKSIPYSSNPRQLVNHVRKMLTLKRGNRMRKKASSCESSRRFFKISYQTQMKNWLALTKRVCRRTSLRISRLWWRTWKGERSRVSHWRITTSTLALVLGPPAKTRPPRSIWGVATVEASEMSSPMTTIHSRCSVRVLQWTHVWKKVPRQWN